MLLSSSQHPEAPSLLLLTLIEEQTKTKFKVYLDGTFAFVLYKGELKRFGIKQGEDLTQENYEKIQNEVLLKRAKKRAMHLLEDMDRTESALRKKLKAGQYPENAISGAIDFPFAFTIFAAHNKIFRISCII